MRVGSLFSGIGGIDLGLERAGMQVIWQSEIDPYACRILKKHWPDVPNLGDVRKIQWENVEPPDLIAGGFPCQSVSWAGDRRGQNDERWLWPEFARAISVLRPRYILAENVPGILVPFEYPKRSGQWWPAPIEEVITDLAALGYDAEWENLPAVAFGAPHIRYRVFIVAYSQRGPDAPERRQREDPSAQGSERRNDEGRSGQDAERPTGSLSSTGQDPAIDSHSNSHGCEILPQQTGDSGREQGRNKEGSFGNHADRLCSDVAYSEIFTERPGLRADQSGGIRRRRSSHRGSAGGSRSTESNVCGMADGIPEGLDDPWESEWEDVPRVARNIPSRVERLRALGNAVVPQIAEWIGQLILDRAKAKR